MTEYLFMVYEWFMVYELLLRQICLHLHPGCYSVVYHWKYVLFVSPVSTTDGDKKKRQKGKETLEPNIVLPIRLATLKVRLKMIKHFLIEMLKRRKSQLKLKNKEIKLSNDKRSD